MRIVIAGGSGFLGRPLIKRLKTQGHDITQLVRRPATKPEHMTWDPAEPIELPEDTAAIINLCGASIGHRWTDAFRKEVHDSRVLPSATLAEAAARQRIPVLLNASGVGIYGDSGDREITEKSPNPQTDFLARVAVEWEHATRPAADAGTRVVLLRTGFPLHASGGLLKPQMLPFKMGIGGKLGNGRQWLPWISREDWLRAAEFLLTADAIAGPVNMAGPKPVTNAEFTKALGEAVHRPAIMPIPKLAVRVLFGEYAEEGYRSYRVMPKVLSSNGFAFNHRSVRTALKAALN